MSVNRISTRYAKSLLDLAIEQNSLENTYKDIKEFNNALKSRDLILMLKVPSSMQGKKHRYLKYFLVISWVN